MAPVRVELMRVVYSTLTDEEATERMRDVVRSHPQAAKATLSYVSQIRDQSYGYETDRAYRVLVAAMCDSAPDPVSPTDAELFERERALGWSTLGDAFDQLARDVPELAEIAQLVGSQPRTKWDRPVHKLVGPYSSQTDPLLRSWLARSIVARYLRVVEKGPDRARLRQPVWRRGSPD